jgi:hypothetical protein
MISYYPGLANLSRKGVGKEVLYYKSVTFQCFLSYESRIVKKSFIWIQAFLRRKQS